MTITEQTNKSILALQGPKVSAIDFDLLAPCSRHAVCCRPRRCSAATMSVWCRMLSTLRSERAHLISRWPGSSERTVLHDWAQDRINRTGVLRHPQRIHRCAPGCLFSCLLTPLNLSSRGGRVRNLPPERVRGRSRSATAWRAGGGWAGVMAWSADWV